MELLRDRSKEFEERGVRVMAASRDSAWSHVAWIQALDLNFPLLSDWNGDAVRGFGIARDYRGMADVAHRSAFLIDTNGRVRGAWAYEDGDVPDVDELVAAAGRLRE
jgi:glutaredoxin-dependent peroxiredoxin